MTNPQPIAQPHTEEWHELRKTGIGSSEAAAACGLSDYSTPLEVYLRKTGEILEFEGNEATEFGKVMEPAILQLWQKKMGLPVIDYPCPMYRDPKHRHMFATPDAQTSKSSGVECKSRTWRLAGLPESDHVELTKETPDYIVQAQHQMAVTGWTLMHFAVLVEQRVRCLFVKRHEGLIANMISAEAELWERIENRDPPEPNWEHDRTPQLIRDLHDQVDGQRIELSAAAAEDWEIYRALGRDITELEKQRATLKAKVLHEIGNHSAGVLPGGEKMVRRKLIEKQPYTATPKPYVDVREVKA